MNMNEQCRSCLTRQIQELVGLAGIDKKQKDALLSEANTRISAAALDRPAPFLAREIHSLIKMATGIDDPYAAVKKASNAGALALLPRARKMIRDSADPFAAALALAINGNIIDYGAPGGSGDIESIIGSISAISGAGISGDPAASLLRDIMKAERVLYIGDNSGEIIFDRAFIEVLPMEKIVFVTRGWPILNDATPDDAATAGLDSLVRCIDTGDSTPGIDLSRASAEFLDELKEADMVILKGQGNLETMFNADLGGRAKKDIPLYFLFRVKCDHVSRCTGIETGASALLLRRS